MVGALKVHGHMLCSSHRRTNPMEGFDEILFVRLNSIGSAVKLSDLQFLKSRGCGAIRC